MPLTTFAGRRLYVSSTREATPWLHEAIRRCQGRPHLPPPPSGSRGSLGDPAPVGPATRAHDPAPHGTTLCPTLWAAWAIGSHEAGTAPTPRRGRWPHRGRRLVLPGLADISAAPDARIGLPARPAIAYRARICGGSRAAPHPRAPPRDAAPAPRQPRTPGPPHDRPSTSPLELRGLRKSFGDRVIFDGLDLTLQAGQIARLLGPTDRGRRPSSPASPGRSSQTRGRSSSTDMIFTTRRWRPGAGCGSWRSGTPHRWGCQATSSWRFMRRCSARLPRRFRGPRTRGPRGGTLPSRQHLQRGDVSTSSTRMPGPRRPEARRPRRTLRGPGSRGQEALRRHPLLGGRGGGAHFGHPHRGSRPPPCPRDRRHRMSRAAT